MCEDGGWRFVVVDMVDVWGVLRGVIALVRGCRGESWAGWRGKRNSRCLEMSRSEAI